MMGKRILYIAVASLLTLSGCMKFVDDGFWTDVNDLEERILELEGKCAKLNETAESLLALAGACNTYDFVKSYSPIYENDKIVGYKIILEKGGELSLYNGNDGNAGRTPVVSLEQGEDGNFYWMVDGFHILDADGKPVEIKSSYLPQFKIVEGEWYISVDHGANWDKLGTAAGADGQTYVYGIVDNGNSISITLHDDSVIVVPKFMDIAVSFSQESLVVSPGATVRISYALSGTMGTYQVEAAGEGGWNADVVKVDNLSGHLDITAPDPITDAKVTLFIGNEYNQMIVRTLSFIDGSCNNL